MPGNGFALAVGVGGEDQFVGVLEGVGDILETLLGSGVDFPAHGEILVRLYRTVFGRQVADVPKTGEHTVIRAEILVQRLGFGRGLDDKNIHANGPEGGELANHPSSLERGADRGEVPACQSN